jgi:hypothetical protein
MGIEPITRNSFLWVVLVGLVAIGLSGCVLVPVGYAPPPDPGYGYYAAPPPGYVAPAPVYVAPPRVYGWGHWGWGRRHWR